METELKNRKQKPNNGTKVKKNLKNKHINSREQDNEDSNTIDKSIVCVMKQHNTPEVQLAGTTLQKRDEVK